MRTKRKGTKAGLKRKADKMFSEIVRSVNNCQLRGLDKIECRGVLQCMHIITRSNHNLRWDTANALCGCQAHHFYYTNQPWEWQEMIQKHFPDRYAYVNEWKNEIWDKDIDAIVEGLERVVPYDEI